MAAGVGDKVKVVRGKKVPIGTLGTVKWAGNTRYGPSVGLVLQGEEGLDQGLTFVDAKNVEVLDEQDDEPQAPQPQPDGKDRVLEAVRAELAQANARATKLLGDVDFLGEKIRKLQDELADARAALDAEKRAGRDDRKAAQHDAKVHPVLDEAYLARVAAFAAQNAESAIKIALRQKLAPVDPRAEAERLAKLEARVNGTATRKLDLSHEAAFEVETLVPVDTAPVHHGEDRHVAKIARPLGVEAPDGEGDPAPETPKKELLARCPKCKGFKFGNHSCKQ
jgi:hypothetical protein